MLTPKEYRFMCGLMDGSSQIGGSLPSLQHIGTLNSLMVRGLIELGFKPSCEGYEQIAWYEEREAYQRTKDSTAPTTDGEDPEKLAKLIAARVKSFGLLSARKLVSGLGTLDNIINAEPADLDAIFGKGSIKSMHLRKYLSDPANVDHLRLGAQAKPKGASDADRRTV